MMISPTLWSGTSKLGTGGSKRNMLDRWLIGRLSLPRLRQLLPPYRPKPMMHFPA